MLKRLKILLDGKHPLNWYRPEYRKFVEQARDQGATHFTYEWRENWVVFFRLDLESGVMEDSVFYVNRAEILPWKKIMYKMNTPNDPRKIPAPYVNPIEIILE